MSWMRWITPARTSSMRSSSKLTMMAVVRPSSETRSPRIRSSPTARRRISAGSRVSSFSSSGRTDDAAVVLGRRQRLHDRRGGKAVDLLHRIDALDVAGDPGERAQRVAREQPVGRLRLQRDDEHARAGEFGAQPLVVLVDRVVPREPGGDVVVDDRDVGAGRQRQGAEDEERRQREPPAVDAAGEPFAHRTTRSSSRRLKSASFRPTL